MTKAAWWSNTDRKSWSWGGKPTGRFFRLACVCIRVTALMKIWMLLSQMDGVATRLPDEHTCKQTQGFVSRHSVRQWERSGFCPELLKGVCALFSAFINTFLLLPLQHASICPAQIYLTMCHSHAICKIQAYASGSNSEQPFQTSQSLKNVL